MAMTVRTICLAILYEGEATGYEIRKLSTEGEYAYFVDASYGAIYPALARLEDENLVTARIEAQDGKPAKKIYAITAEGRRVFIGSLFDRLGEDDLKSEFLLFARFAPELPQSLVSQRINERLDQTREMIKELEDHSAKDVAPADRWVLDFGLTCMRSAHAYLVGHRDDLIAMARPEEGAAAAE
jgi:DNA-binding PadR family transcriptional regulator